MIQNKKESPPCDPERIAPKQESIEEQLGRIRVQMRELYKRLERLEHHRHDSDGRASIALNEINHICL